MRQTKVRKYDGILQIWLDEYNNQRNKLNMNVKAATENHITKIACEMGLMLEGQQLTGYRDVMSIIKTKT